MTMLSDRFFMKNLAKLALPIAAQSFMLSAVSVADTLMLGGVTQNAMAAVSLASKFQFLQNMFISSVVAAFTILGAQYWGKQDRDAIHRLFSIAMRLSGTISVLFFAACEFVPELMMNLFTNDPELNRIASEYLRIAAWSYLLTGFSQCYLGLLKISDHASDTAVISSVTVVLNIVLNGVLIFGLIWRPMGVQGAALATLCARVVELVWAVGLSFRRNYLRPDLSRLFARHGQLSRDYFRCMLPMLGAGLLWGVGFTSYSAFMGHIDQDAPAANSVASSVIELVCCLCNGLANGGGILVGNCLGAGDLERGKLYGTRLVKMSYAVGAATSLFMVAITPLVMSIVQLNEVARGYLSSMMAVMSVYTIGRVVNTITINGVFSAGGDTMFDMYSLAVTMWGIALPRAFLGTFVFHWPVWLVYACTCLDEVGKIPWVMLHFRKYRWVRDLTREKAEA